MAAIAIGNCTVTVEAQGAGFNVVKVLTPATADQADTVDLSTVCDAGNIYNCSVENATDGLLTATVSAAGTVILPSGGTDNEARSIYVLCQTAKV